MPTNSRSVGVPFVDLSRAFNRDKDEIFQSWEGLGSAANFVLGAEVRDFENRISSYLGARYCVSVNSGSDALWLSLKALNIGHGDEVITVANTFIATAWAIAAVGATPVMVDVGLDMNISPEAVEAAINSKTRAIVSVHLAGNPAKLRELNSLAHDNKLVHIEDSAQAIGASLSGKKIGSGSLAAAFSLHPLKNLGVLGDGGFVATNSDEVYEKLKLLRNHGLVSRDNVTAWGFNSRLDAFQAAVANIRLKKLDVLNERRIAIANFYKERLGEYIDFQEIAEDSSCVFHNCIARSKHRDELVAFAAKKKVEVKIHYPIPIHMQPILGNPSIRLTQPLLMTEALVKEIFSLPVFPELTDTEIEIVENTIRSFFNAN
jgi:dTDP-4-amino-4,6-dideoxygalactose transaminase